MASGTLLPGMALGIQVDARVKITFSKLPRINMYTLGEKDTPFHLMLTIPPKTQP